jgi:hypothetical protein
VNICDRVARAEAAIIALANVEFGDAPGHDFHGNQWTDGGDHDMGELVGEPKGWTSLGGWGSEQQTSTGYTLRHVEGGSWSIEDRIGKRVAAGSGGKAAAEAFMRGESAPESKAEERARLEVKPDYDEDLLRQIDEATKGLSGAEDIEASWSKMQAARG